MCVCVCVCVCVLTCWKRFCLWQTVLLAFASHSNLVLCLENYAQSREHRASRNYWQARLGSMFFSRSVTCWAWCTTVVWWHRLTPVCILKSSQPFGPFLDKLQAPFVNETLVASQVKHSVLGNIFISNIYTVFKCLGWFLTFAMTAKPPLYTVSVSIPPWESKVIYLLISYSCEIHIAYFMILFSDFLEMFKVL